MPVRGTVIQATHSSRSKDKGTPTVLPAPTATEYEKYEKTWAMIYFIVEAAVCKHYKNISNPFGVWEKIRDLLSARNWMARNRTLRDLATRRPSKYNSLYDYAMKVKRYRNRMIDLGAIFRTGHMSHNSDWDSKRGIRRSLTMWNHLPPRRGMSLISISLQMHLLRGICERDRARFRRRNGATW